MTATSTRSGSLPSMPGRGRPSDYTPEEDAIILKHRNTDDVLRLLKAAGFPERTPAAIWSRRRYLNEVGASGEAISLLSEAADAALPGLAAKRRKLQERLQMLEEERDRLYEDIADVSAQMHRLIDRE